MSSLPCISWLIWGPVSFSFQRTQIDCNHNHHSTQLGIKPTSKDLGFYFNSAKNCIWASFNVCLKACIRYKKEEAERETCTRMEREKQGMNSRPLEKIELKSETISSSGRCSALSSPNTTLESSKPSIALFFIFSYYETSHTAMDDERHRIMIREERRENPTKWLVSLFHGFNTTSLFSPSLAQSLFFLPFCFW